jgi:hypothetical protein
MNRVRKSNLALVIAIAAVSLLPLRAALAREPAAEDLRRCRQATSLLLDLEHRQEVISDKRLLFTMTHYLISSYLSEAVRAGSFLRPDLVTEMNTAFVSRLPGVQNHLPTYWRAALAQCSGDVSNVDCAMAMAAAHIDGDLHQVVEALPCMPQADWDAVYQLCIRPALADAVEFIATTRGKESLAYREFLTRSGQTYTRWKRNTVRAGADCGH